jgi:muramoyltetrapeptide carboxypeptidase
MAPPPRGLALPRYLAPGARIRVVGPSGPFELEPFTAGVARLRERYLVEWDPELIERKLGYLAGTDEERRSELQSALDDPNVDAVWLARGGSWRTRSGL